MTTAPRILASLAPLGRGLPGVLDLYVSTRTREGKGPEESRRTTPRSTPHVPWGVAS